MAKNLKDIDKAAESKGSLLVTVWQFVKFIVVSLLAMVVQIALTNLIPLIPAVQEMYAQPINILGILDYPVNTDAAGAIISGGLGYCIAFNVGNIVAQIVAFFVNKEKTFNSGANVAITLPIYIVFTIALIFFSAWLSPTLNTLFLGFGWAEALARNAAMMICSALQFFLYFPVDKILFHKKKEEK
jgi:putative flippase GtrA